MAQDATPTNADSGQEPGGEQGQQEPTKGQEPESGTPAEPPTFDASYVAKLRGEAAAERTKRAEAERRLQELADRDKSEAERLAERAAENERKAAEAESRALRYEVAADRKLDLSAADFLSGSTREEVEASADKLAALLATKASSATRGSFDGGARKTPDATKSPEEAHNALLLGALGLKPDHP